MSARSNLGISRFFSRKLLRQPQADFRNVVAKQAAQRRTRSMLVETLEDRRLLFGECGDDSFTYPMGDPFGGCSSTGWFNSDSNLNATLVPSPFTTNPVNVFNGLPFVQSTDVASESFDAPLAHTRSFAGLNKTGSNGNGWVVSSQPYLVVHSEDFVVGYIESGQATRLFGQPDLDPLTGIRSWRSHNHLGGHLLEIPIPNTTQYEWVLIDPNGNKLLFYDLPRAFGPLSGLSGLSGGFGLQSLSGKLKQVTKKNGEVINFSYAPSNQLSTIRRVEVGSGLIEQLSYTYVNKSNSMGGSVELLHSVTLARGSSLELLSPVRTAEYDYYTGEGPDASHGRLGDLKLVTVRNLDLSGPTIEQEYYRYYKMPGKSANSEGDYGPTNNPAQTGGTDITYETQPGDNAVWSGLKLLVKGAEFARMAANFPNYIAEPDAQLRPYANNHYYYERWADAEWNLQTYGNSKFSSDYATKTRYRVVEEMSQGAGCTSCSDGQGSFGFEVHVNQYRPTPVDISFDPNVWRTRTVEYVPNSTNADDDEDGLIDDVQWADNDRYLTYNNEIGQVVLKVLVQVNGQVHGVSAISSSHDTSTNYHWVTIVSASHGLSDNDRIAINGSKSYEILGEIFKRPGYNGVFEVDVLDTDTFKIKLGLVEPNSTTTQLSTAVDPSSMHWTKVSSWSADYYRYRQINPTYFVYEGTTYFLPQITPYIGYGQLLLHAHPSAVNGWDESFYGLVTSELGTIHNNEYLKDNQGLIDLYTFYDTTSPNISESVAGSVDKYHWQTKVKHGELDGGNVLSGGIVIEEKEYKKREAGGATVYPIGKHTRFADVAGNQPQITTYDYTWHTGTTQAASTTVTQPIVSVDQNGSGTAESSTTVFDIYGRPTWTKDADGFINYTRYDTGTGAVTKSIHDVDTAQTNTFSDLPNGWSTPVGGGLHLTTTMEVDGLGRTTKLTDPNGNVTYTVYNDANREVRVYPGWNATTGTTTGPIQVRRQYWPTAPGGISFSTDPATPYELVVTGQVVYNESLTSSATPTREGTAGSYKPNGEEIFDDFSLQSLTRELTNNAGQVLMRLQFFSFVGLDYQNYSSIPVLGTESNSSDTGNYHATYMVDGDRGWIKRVEDATGTITRYIRDARGLVTQVWVGTDDVPNSGFWLPTNNAGANMTLVTQNEYDGGLSGGNGNLTKVTQYPGGGAPERVTQHYYDWRDRRVATKTGVKTSESVNDNTSVISYTTYDNLGRALSRSSYDGDNVQIVDANSDGVPDAPAVALLRQVSTSQYDSRSRLFRSTQYPIDPLDPVDPLTDLEASHGLVTAYWFDRRGNVVKQQQPGAATTKHVYDGAGRQIKSYTTDASGDTSWANALNVTGDIVLTQTENTFDSAGNLILSHQQERFHTASGTGELLDVGHTTNASRSYFTAMYYDAANRQVATVQAGTNEGVNYTRPMDVPMRDPEEPLLITSLTYDAAGRLELLIDPKLLITKTQYDALGRTKRTIENLEDESPSGSDDHIVDQVYNGANQPVALIVVMRGDLGDNIIQETRYIYGAATARGDAISSNRLMIETRYPDKATGLASASEKDSYTYNALGERITATDRNNTTHAFDFDVLGRLASDTATSLNNSLVDDSVRRIGFSYNTQGLQHQITSYSDTAGATTPVNQIQRQYNGLGQLTGEYQSHSGPVQTGTTPQVQYNYSTPSAANNHSRATGIVYPNGRAISYNYAAGVDNAISRLTSISDSSASLENYDYLGASTVVRRAHAQPGVDLSYIKLTGESNADAGDQYTGLDRFGRVVDQRWRTSAADVDRFQYTYDQNGNRLSRNNAIDSALNEMYSYDDMNRLTSTQRGTMDARIVGSYFFHKGSFFDQSGGGTDVQTALDTGKALAREQVGALTLTYQNLINTTRGINGLVFDIQDLASTNLTAADFVFQMSPQFVFNEQNNPPTGWGAAPTPTIQVVAASGSTPARVILRWTDNAIANRWLRVTLKSHINTGLFKDEIFYAGHLRGETTGVANGVFSVSFIPDRAPIQAAMGTNVGVNSTVDIDKNGLVQLADIVAVQSNSGSQLPAIGLAANPLADLTQSQRWTLDGQGNWIGLENNWGGVQSRTHNSQNQVTQVGSATLSFDASGNMTTDEQGRTLKYDAWNRLVKVEQNGNVVSQYQYDGLKRRITEQQGTQPQRVLYYSANWQVLEERESGVVQAQQVWSPVYADDLILRDRNADNNNGNGLEQRHYVAQDANFNVTALIGATTGAVVERYYYQAYGVPTVLDANFVPRATGQSQFAWRYLHQGGRFDWAAGLYHFRNRDLSPILGRWLNHDPIGFEGSKWNLYEYVEGRPTVGLDPSGLHSLGHVTIGPDGQVCLEEGVKPDCFFPLDFVSPIGGAGRFCFKIGSGIWSGIKETCKKCLTKKTPPNCIPYELLPGRPPALNPGERVIWESVDEVTKYTQRKIQTPSGQIRTDITRPIEIGSKDCAPK